MNTKIKLISLLIIIGIIVLVFPNFVNAKTVTLSNSTKVYTYAPPGTSTSTWRSYTIGELISGTLATTSSTHTFRNEFLFCYEPGQDLSGTNYYLVMEKYKLEDNKVTKYTRSKKNTSFSSAGSKTSSACINFAKGLAYIMSFYKDSSYSHDRLGDERSYYNFGPTCDEVNLALWAYLDEFYNSSNTEIKKFFGIPRQDVTINNSSKKISKSTAYYNDSGSYKWVTGSSTKAYTLYKQALDIYNGKLNYSVTAEFYKFREVYDPGSQQDLMFLKTATIEEEPEIPEIKLNFYKVDYNSTKTGLSGAKLKIEKASNSNIDSISKTTIQSSGTTGKFDTITITPTESNPGTVKIKVTEIKAPDGYDKLSDLIVLTIKYNKETGSVTEITEDSDYIDTSKSSGVGVVKFKNKPLVKLRLYKRDYGDVSKKVNGAKIKIERETNVANINGGTSAVTLTSSGDYGFFDQITLEPTDRSKQMKIKITETTVPTNYVGLPSAIILTIKYNSDTGEVTSVTADKNSEYFKFETPTSGNHDGKGLIYIKNRKNLKIHIAGYKKDEQTKEALQGAKFKATFTQDSKVFAEKTVTSDANGYVDFTEVKPLSKNKITVNIQEIEAPSGWMANYNKTIEFTYDETNQTWKKEKDEGNIINNTSTTSDVYLVNLKDIENSSQIEKLQILKTDEKTSNALNGVNFKIELENIKSVNGSGYNNPIETTTDSNGKLELNNLIIKDVNKNIKITITETQAPVGYKKIEGPITIELKRTGNTLKVIGGSAETPTKEVSLDNAKIAQHQVFLNIKNIPIMNIGGIVWRDGQTGEKNPVNPNGKYGDAGDQALSGIEVILVEGEPAFDSSGNITNEVARTKSANGGEIVSYTGHAGTKQYKLQKGEYLFTEIENKDNYYVVFKYDGITYKTVEKGSEKNSSKAEEIGRDSFNDKFKTIAKEKAIAESGEETSLEYQELDKASKLITEETNGSIKQIKQKFVIYAKSEKVDSKNWQNTWTKEGSVNKDDSRLNINCGLLEKVFDLAIGTDVKSAKLKINGKETTYTYADIINGKINADLENKSSEAANAVYNLYLYQSDYNYRIDDYITDVNGTSPDTNNDNIPDYQQYDGVSKELELKAEVTYSVILKAQTTQESTVEEFVYYYDEMYGNPKITTDVYNTVEDEDARKITFTKKPEITEPLLTSSNNYRVEVDITFEIDIIGLDEAREDGKNATNVVEITKYSTDEGGYIDRDSQPGNWITDGKFEDDTDEAKVINISVQETRKREISGTVFEDIKTDDRNIDGINNDGTAVNDVIVQLIEIKRIGEKDCEYIWQETRSGNNTVKTTARNGYPGNSDENGIASGSGQYEFTDFIPGNYIIRFIYGDGRTYNLTPTEAKNVEKYNGQAYQSTVDKNYDKKWYNTSGYGVDVSVATDNEARRLETMAYTVEVDSFVGVAIKSISTGFEQLTDEEKDLISQYYDSLLTGDIAGLETACEIYDSSKQLADIDEDSEKYGVIKQYALQKTWMCAETLKINIPVDAIDKEKKVKDPKSETSTDKPGDTINLNNMNFGLRLRPQTKLTVEKHITALKIVPTGVGVQSIVDAKVGIDDILDGNIDNKQGITTGLAIIPSTRDERGFWKVETDIEELAQGAKLEVEYTYVIRNNSDDYCLSNYLISEYKNNIDNLAAYKTILETKAGEVKTSGVPKGTFLGKYYYTNSKGTDESSNLARVDKLEEALNNQLSYNESVAGASFEKTNTTGTVKKNYYNEVGKIEELEIETILATKSSTGVLGINGMETDRTLKLETTISSLTNGEIGATIPSYITQITSYSNAAGIVNMGSATPGNLAYIHCADKGISLDSYVKKDQYGNIEGPVKTVATVTQDDLDNGYIQMNEYDEFWGETIIISKPTGLDKNTILIITAIAISSAAVIGVGIILIKKRVLKK